jgi:hypothetical protein
MKQKWQAPALNKLVQAIAPITQERLPRAACFNFERRYPYELRHATSVFSKLSAMLSHIFCMTAVNAAHSPFVSVSEIT